MALLRNTLFARTASNEGQRIGGLDAASLWHTARLNPALLWRYRVWKPGHAHAVFGRRHAPSASASDATHLQAAAEWLGRAQDASPDGGVVGRYRLDRGWTSSYPETTGYIVPTFLELARCLDPQYLGRARRCIEFLLSMQLPSGAFPTGEIATNATRPSPFNTAQIIHGLLRWHQHQDDPRSLAAARRAADWLISVQEADGAWRRWAYLDVPAAYSAYLSCWLVDLGLFCSDERYLASAARHLDWVLAHRFESGWIQRCGFTEQEHVERVANLHTIAYTLGGLWRTGQGLGRADALDAVQSGARGVASALARLGWLPGMLDDQWRARADSACLTGNAQMALIWMDLRDHTGDDAWLSPAYQAIELVKQTQLLHSPNPNLRGGIPGADPVWGSYQAGVMPSWSAKFFIDALLRKAEIEGRR